MKKLLLVAAIFMTILTSSCTNNDDESIFNSKLETNQKSTTGDDEGTEADPPTSVEEGS